MKSINKDHIILRNIVLSGEIDDAVVKETIQCISYINELDNSNKEKLPIKLIINSIGGSMYDGFALIGVIENSVTPIHTYGYGAVMSMALPILLSGHQRFGHSLTTFMYHECLDSMHYDKISTLKENLDEGDRLMDIYDEYVLSRTSFKRTQLDKVKKNKTDWYFGVNEAIKYGVIDEII